MGEVQKLAPLLASTPMTSAQSKPSASRLTPARVSLLALLLIAQLCALAYVRHPRRRRTTFALPLLPDLYDDYVSRISPLTSFTVTNRSASQAEFFEGAPDSADERHLYDIFVTQYVSFHRSRRHSNSSAVLIYRPLRTGFGDRYQRLLKAYYLAVLSGRVLLIDWQTPFALEEFIENANENTDFFFRAENDTRRATYDSALHLDDYNDDEGKYFMLLDSLKENDVLVVDTPRVSNEALVRYATARMPKSSSIAAQFLTNVNMHRAVWHNCLRLRPTVLQSTKRYLGSFGLRMSGREGEGRSWWHLREYIAVHARMGIGLNESNDSRFVQNDTELETYARCLATRAVAATSLAGIPPLPIFLATDTPAFREVFVKNVHAIDSKVSVVYGDGPVMHSNDMARRIKLKERDGEYTDEERTTFERIVAATYTDLACIAFSAHTIALYSSFPRFAVAVGNAESLAELKVDVCRKQFI